MRCFIAAPFGLLATPAFAVETGAGGGFLPGLLHPVLGFDHLLAMVAVGLLSVQIGGRAIWMVPAAFVAALALGAVVGMQGVSLPEVEGVIALSVLALGGAIALQASMPIAVGMVFVAVFALFHGHAHGTEIPTMAEPANYVAGFVIASAVLHLAGVGMGLMAGQPHARALLGATIAGVGLHMSLLSYGVV